MKHLCILLIRFYRKFLSPLKRHSTCRFVPTCSAYALEAFQKRGFFVGLFLTVRRILRCNPYHPGGYDPVPEKGLIYRGSNVIPDSLIHDCHPDSGTHRGDGAEPDTVSDREADGKPDRASVQGKEKNQ